MHTSEELNNLKQYRNALEKLTDELIKKHKKDFEKIMKFQGELKNLENYLKEKWQD